MSNEISVMESVYNKNDRVASELNRELTEKGVFCVNVLGAPGAGKTTFLINIIKLLPFESSVIEGDIESDIDAGRLGALGIRAFQINTRGACHLDSPLVDAAYRTLSLEKGVLFIENIGNLVCPAEFVIGEHIKLLICSVTEGDDKPYKYPLAFEKADVILINKTDLAPYADFDGDYFTKGVRTLNKTAPLFRINARDAAGYKEVSEWLTQRASSVINA